MYTKAKTSSPSQQSSSITGCNTSDAKADKLQSFGSYYGTEPALDIASQLRDDAKRTLDIAAMWCFGMGVVPGWTLRG